MCAKKVICYFSTDSIEAIEMMPLYVAFFNSGVLPDSWLEGVIRPNTKTKDDSKSPENYRPITILSWFGKSFIYTLYVRLNDFINAHTVLGENQADIAKTQKKKLFCSCIG